MRPLLLDLFCGAGGAAVGYHQAGFDVVGIDIESQPHYPFEFVQADVMTLPATHWKLWDRGWDAIHASPPCQDYSVAMRHLANPQPRLIEPVREMLADSGGQWVIENVPGAPLAIATDLFGGHGVELCGTQFGLRIRRHRLFETSWPISAPETVCDHSQPAMNPHNQVGRDRIYAEFGRGDPEAAWRQEMGVEWMNKHEGREAIPPAYTEWIGWRLLDHLRLFPDPDYSPTWDVGDPEHPRYNPVGRGRPI